MSVEFQNGFLCGMATKGMLRTENQYEPKIWNDSGVYTYFYMDFKRSVADFSTGMLKSSLIIYDSVEMAIMGFERVNNTTFKIFADISNRPHGVTVTNKKTSLLVFASARKVPPFSVHMYVEGQAPFVNKAYAYEQALYTATSAMLNPTDAGCATSFWPIMAKAEVYDIGEYAHPLAASTITEAINISFWAV